jgi:hypothetical protein
VQQSTTLSSSLQQCHNSILPLSPPLGDVDSHPKVEVFVVQRNVELVVSRADLSLVLVALVGGNQLAVTSEEFQAHLSSRFHVSVGAARGCAWLRATLHASVSWMATLMSLCREAK